MSWTVPVAFCYVAAGAALGQDIAAELRAQLQPLVAASAQSYGSAVSVGLVTSSVSLEVFAGAIDSLDGKTGAASAEGDQYLWGSVTKTMVGAGIMQLVSQGKVGLDDKAHIHIDPMLKRARYPYPTLEELFTADRWGVAPAVQYNASDITVRHLMSMTSGIHPFDTDGYRDFQFRHSSTDISPLDIFDWVHGPLMFQPGGHVPGGRPGSMSYCSVNFLLLGYILAYHAGAADWSSYDQMSMLPAPVQKRMAGLAFPLKGPCRQYTRVHGFDTGSVAAPFDVFNTSCLGSWAAGNVVMPSKAAAEWARALYGSSSEVVPKELVQQMLPKPHEFYGLATMQVSGFTGVNGTYGEAVGHLGDTYGFTSIMAYLPGLDAGFSVAMNHEGRTQGGPTAVFCTAYNRALDVLLHRSYRNCSYVPGSYYGGKCECSNTSSTQKESFLVV